MIRGFRVGSATMATVAFVVVSTGTALSQTTSLRFETLQQYGTEDPPAGARLGGSSFERIAGIRSFPDGRVAVLDAGGKKVVLFARDGRFLRTIGLGSGRGPGEFVLPIALDVSEGRIAVFDYDGNRVTVFDTLGKVLWTRNTPRAKQIVLVGDTLYGSYMPGRQFMVWRQVPGDQQSVERLIAVSASTVRDFDPLGVVAMLARGRDGEILVADGRPGFWYSLPGSAAVQGADLLPGARIIPYQDMQVPPSQAAGIVALSERHVGIAFNTFAPHPTGPPHIARRELAIFDRASGKLLGRVDISRGETSVPVIGPGFVPFEILIARQEPYPHVERVALRGLQ